MDVAKRTVAAYLALTAVVVAANVVLTPVYHNGNPDYPVWEIVKLLYGGGRGHRPRGELYALPLRAG